MENRSDLFMDTQPSTSAAVSSGREPSSIPLDGPVKMNSIGSFYFLYEVGKKLASGSHGTVHEGIRRTDGRRVIVKFVKKRQFDFHIDQSEPLCREAATMQIMKHCDHVMKLYDWFEVVHHNILTMEHPGTHMTLRDFVKENRGRLSEAEAKVIMQRLIAALQHCSDQGVYYKNISLRKVLIDKDTMQIKLTGFYRALTISERQTAEFQSEAERTVHTSKLANEGLHRVLKGMVQRNCRWCCWRNTRLSEECQDLLGKLRDRKSDITLQNIVGHDWFTNTPDTPGREPTAATGAPETEPMVEDAEPSTSSAGPAQVCPQTSREGPTPAASAPETEPMVEYAGPSTSAAGPAQVCPQTPGQEPTPAADAPETEPRKPRLKLTLKKAVPAETTDLTLMFPNDLQRQKEHFRSLYVVGRKLENNDLVRTGIRRSDELKVVIKFVLRPRGQEKLGKPVIVRDGESMMKLQKIPNCSQIIRFYDRFITEESYILVTEYLPVYMAFDNFLETNRGILRESTAKWIIRQIIRIMRLSMDQGLFFDVNKKWILINPITMNIKLLDFDVVFFTKNEEDQALMRKVLFSRKTMLFLISRISHPIVGPGYMSRDCRDFQRSVLLRKTRGCKRRHYDLESVLCHPWLRPR